MNFNKNTLQNAHLLQDLKREAWTADIIAALKTANVTTYEQLFSLIRDEQADPQPRADVCDEIRRLFNWIDKRRFVPPLLDALKTSHEPLLQNAIQALGNLESKRAVTPIINLVGNKTLSYDTRRFAILVLVEIGDKNAIPSLVNIMFDSTDDIKIREDAIEQTAWFFDSSLVKTYIQLLSDPESDMRFWAAYGLTVMRTDISAALRELDRVAAFDHVAPDGWWHIDREALDPLENIYWQRLGLRENEDSRKRIHVISPAPEYSTFKWLFNRWPYGEYKKLKPPSLKVDHRWLTKKLREEWPSIRLNIRKPRPQTYLLDWLIEIDGEPLIGGLHREQYAVVITGNLKAMRVFATWYRSIIEPKQYLFLYEWAGLATELKSGMSETGIEMEQADRDKHTNALDERDIKYPWVIETD
ncbi:MAG: HEAT repeat domain-containing protein [Anaerolineae bacterium]|nr:HEAT repeat domain-containing protein [Anaerolineae bacterium]